MNRPRFPSPLQRLGKKKTKNVNPHSSVRPSTRLTAQPDSAGGLKRKTVQLYCHVRQTDAWTDYVN
jgi:hypothetical protein